MTLNNWTLMEPAMFELAQRIGLISREIHLPAGRSLIAPETKLHKTLTHLIVSLIEMGEMDVSEDHNEIRWRK